MTNIGKTRSGLLSKSPTTQNPQSQKTWRTAAIMARPHGAEDNVKARLPVVFVLSSIFVLSCACVAQDGAAVYQKRCAMCHESPKGRIPSVESLRRMSSASILRALESGAMREQAKDLSGEERHNVAAYLGG